MRKNIARFVCILKSQGLKVLLVKNRLLGITIAKNIEIHRGKFVETQEMVMR